MHQHAEILEDLVHSHNVLLSIDNVIQFHARRGYTTRHTLSHEFPTRGGISPRKIAGSHGKFGPQSGGLKLGILTFQQT